MNYQPSTKKCKELNCEHLARRPIYADGTGTKYVCEIVDRIPGNIPKCPISSHTFLAEVSGIPEAVSKPVLDAIHKEVKL